MRKKNERFPCMFLSSFVSRIIGWPQKLSFAVFLPNSDLAKQLRFFHYSSGGACFHDLCQVTDYGKLGAPELRHTYICMHV